MKKNIAPAFWLLAVLLVTGCAAQMGYTQYSINDGLKLSYKWGTARDTTGDMRKALLMRAENLNNYAIEYSYTLDLYYEGILRETTTIENQCLNPSQVSMGKLNGIYFIPQRFTTEQLEGSDFSLQINNISATGIPECSGEAETE